MRKKSISVLTTLRASFPKRAFVDALSDVKDFTFSELEQLYDELGDAELDKQPGRQRKPKTSKSDANMGDGTPASRIKRLLTVDAGLSSRQSISALRTELTEMAGNLPSKTNSLDRWLEAALILIPAGEVLNAAMSIAARSHAK